MSSATSLLFSTTEELASTIGALSRPLTLDDVPCLPLSDVNAQTHSQQQGLPRSALGERLLLSGRLIWAKALILERTVPSLQRDDLQRLLATFRLAARHGAFLAAGDIADRLDLVPRSHALLSAHPELLEIGFSLCKIQKLRGRFSQAAELTRSLVPAALAFSDRDARQIALSRILLSLGKAAHSHQWRTGYYLTLARLAVKRLREVQQRAAQEHESAVCRALAIALDCQASISAELIQKLRRTGGRARGRSLTSVQHIWSEAEENALRCGESRTFRRIRLRRLYSLFSSLPSAATRTEFLKEYSDLLELVVVDSRDPRAVAVRAGQLAEMLAECDHLEEAEARIFQAVEAAKQVFDWRSLALNYSRAAAIRMRSLRRTHDASKIYAEIIELLVLARKQLTQLEEPPPELEVFICMRLAEAFRRNGNPRDSVGALDEARSCMLAIHARLRDETRLQLLRTSRDSRSIAWRKEYVPKHLLSSPEIQMVCDSVIVDWDLLTSLQQEIFLEGSLSVGLLHHDQILRAVSQTASESLAVALHKSKAIVDSSIQQIGHAIETEFRGDVVAQSRLNHKLTSFLREASRDAGRELAKIFNTRDYDAQGHAPGWHALSTIVERAITNNIPLYRGLGASHVSRRVKQDFRVHCHPDLFAANVTELIVNAAREVGRFVPNGKVFIDINTRADPNLSRKVGVLMVVDSAGRLEQLRTALESAKGLCFGAGGELRGGNGFGLANALRFFRRFEGEISASGIEGRAVTLTITLPHGAFVEVPS